MRNTHTHSIFDHFRFGPTPVRLIARSEFTRDGGFDAAIGNPRDDNGRRVFTRTFLGDDGATKLEFVALDRTR